MSIQWTRGTTCGSDQRSLYSSSGKPYAHVCTSIRQQKCIWHHAGLQQSSNDRVHPAGRLSYLSHVVTAPHHDRYVKPNTRRCIPRHAAPVSSSAIAILLRKLFPALMPLACILCVSKQCKLKAAWPCDKLMGLQRHDCAWQTCVYGVRPAHTACHLHAVGNTYVLPCLCTGRSLQPHHTEAGRLCSHSRAASHSQDSSHGHLC